MTDRLAHVSSEGPDAWGAWSRAVSLGLWMLVGLLACRAAFFVVSMATRPTSGFVAYYTASRLLEDGADVARFYDDEWFRAQVARVTPTVADIYMVNPPTTALLLRPLAGFDYGTARVAWITANLAIFAAGVVWLLRRLDLSGNWMAALVALMLVYQPLAANIALGQVYTLLFVLLVAAWLGFRGHRDRLLGIALGVMLVLKVAGVLLWVLLIATRRWRALGWSLATIVAAIVVSGPWIGPGAWSAYAARLGRLPSDPWLSVTPYQSQFGFFHHLLQFDAVWNPSPLWDAPVLAAGLSVVGAGLLLGMAFRDRLRPDRRDHVFAAVVIANVVVSPQSLDYHYVLLLVPIAILVAQQRQLTLAQRVAVAAGVALIAVDLPYRSPALSHGARAFLAYPKLYGALLLWLVAVWRPGDGLDAEGEPWA